MTLSQKETTLLQDLKSQEQLCVEKYAKYSSDACDGNLKNLFSQIGQSEKQHLDTINQILGGTVPQMGVGGNQANSMQADLNSQLNEENKQKDKYLCSDVLSTEKHVSSTYNTCIFEFKDTNVRNVLNHIQKEEQQHGEQIYNYMSQNGMYN
jgi:Coat F domain.